jgi:uncharacterized protein YecT (DUF1311 family)
MLIHHKYKNLIAPLAEHERHKLEESLYNEGCRDPLVTWLNEEGEEVLLDGHNRYEICERLGIPYETLVIELIEGMMAEEWIIRNQLGRRNLSNYAKGKLAMKLEEIFAIQAKENQRAGGNTSIVGRKNSAQPLKARDRAAESLGISHDTLRKTKTIEEEATPEIKARVEAGEISLNSAYNQVVDKSPTLKKKRDNNLVARLNAWLEKSIESTERKAHLPGAPKEEFMIRVKVLRRVRKKLGELKKQFSCVG